MYVDLFTLRYVGLGAAGGMALTVAVFFATEAGGVFWRRAVAAALLIVGVLALALAVIS